MGKSQGYDRRKVRDAVQFWGLVLGYCFLIGVFLIVFGIMTSEFMLLFACELFLPFGMMMAVRRLWRRYRFVGWMALGWGILTCVLYSVIFLTLPDVATVVFLLFVLPVYFVVWGFIGVVIAGVVAIIERQFGSRMRRQEVVEVDV